MRIAEDITYIRGYLALSIYLGGTADIETYIFFLPGAFSVNVPGLCGTC